MRRKYEKSVEVHTSGEWLFNDFVKNMFMKLRKTENYQRGILTLLLKSRVYQRQYQKQVKMFISSFLFHDWFNLEFVFGYNISLM